jgi:hypothetical protein
VLTKMMKLVCIAALLSAVATWRYPSGYELPVRFVVSLGAFLVARQAVRAGKRSWAGGFYAMMVLFNPFLAMIAFSGDLALFLVLASLALFVVSLRALKTQPLLSIPSITDRTPGSESL